MSIHQLPAGSTPSKLAHNPPFRHDHVGSFLRPKEVRDARAANAAGDLDAEQLRAVENKAIAEHLQKLKENDVLSLTDGEFRREYFHLDFLRQIEGVTISRNDLNQCVHQAPPTLSITSKLRHTSPIELENFLYLKSLVKPEEVYRIKITIPSPTMCHFRGGRKAISEEAYPSLSEFFADLAACYRQEIDALYEAGCRYIQLDDTNLAYLTDEKMRAEASARGEDVTALPKQYCQLINASLASKPSDMIAAVHLCKGNFRSTFFAQGGEEGYAPIAEVMFKELNVDAFFLEWEDERSGKDFSVLKHLPENKTVVLGLVSSKLARLEDEQVLIAKIHDAGKCAPRGVEQLAISPQCGFSSTVHGNEIDYEDQYAKLKLCARVADAVWLAQTNGYH